MAVTYTDEAKFPLNQDGGGNWGAIINGVLEALDKGGELTFTFGETVSAGDCVALKVSDGKIYKALSTDSTLSPAIGFAPNAVSAAATGKVRHFGWIDITNSQSFSAGDTLYVGGTAGGLSDARDSWSSPVGYVKSTSGGNARIVIDPSPRRSEVVRDICVQRQAHFAEEVWLGNLGGTETIDWTTGNAQAGVLNADCSLSFTAPSGPCDVVFRFVGDAVGGHSVTWPVSLGFENGETPAVSVTANKKDILRAYYNGSGNYYGKLYTSYT